MGAGGRGHKPEAHKRFIVAAAADGEGWKAERAACSQLPGLSSGRGRGGRKEPRGRLSDHEAEEDGTSAGRDAVVKPFMLQKSNVSRAKP